MFSKIRSTDFSWCSYLMECISSYFEYRLYFHLKINKDAFYFTKIKTLIYISFSLIGIGIIALIANILTIIVLHQPLMKRSQQTFRHHLILLTLFEIFYNAAFVNFHSWSLSFVLEARKTILDRVPALIVAFSLVLDLSAFATRNWMVAMISAARCEVITRPLASLTKKIITLRRMKIFSLIIFLGMVIMSSLYAFSGVWDIQCLEVVLPSVDNITANSSSHERKFRKVINAQMKMRRVIRVLFVRGLPVFIVIINTVVMVIAMNCKRQSLSQSQGYRNTATRTLIAFAVLFTMIEGIGVSYYIANGLSLVRFSRRAGTALRVFDKYLLLSNSFTNIVANVALNQSFRDTLKSFLLRKRVSIQRSGD